MSFFKFSIVKTLKMIKLIKCVFKDLRFCGYPFLMAFSKTSVFCGTFVPISVNTFIKVVVLLSFFVQIGAACMGRQSWGRGVLE